MFSIFFGSSPTKNDLTKPCSTSEAAPPELCHPHRWEVQQLQGFGGLQPDVLRGSRRKPTVPNGLRKPFASGLGHKSRAGAGI